MRTVPDSPSRTESRALTVALVTGLIAAIAGLLIFPNEGIPLSSQRTGSVPSSLLPVGEVSIGGISSLAAGTLGAASFALAYLHGNRRHARWRRQGALRRLIDTVGVTLAGSVTAALLIASTYTVMAMAFQDLLLDRIAAAGLVAAGTAVAAYVLHLVASELDTRQLASLLALFLVAGVVAAMLTAENPGWWQDNFSALGIGTAPSARTFNLTIVIAGVVLMTLADYLTIDLHPRGHHGRTVDDIRIVRWILVVVGLALVGVGAVPINTLETLHNAFSIVALIGFEALFLVTPIVVRDLPPVFTATSFGFAVGLVLVVVLWVPVGYYNLTATELIAMLMLFAWLVLLARNAAATPEAAAERAEHAIAQAEEAAAEAAAHGEAERRDGAALDPGHDGPVLKAG
ncbi:DUF998 domain-containing protein [Microbacterium album]|uniref:DUF998 domain-containing protein n=1 Tax=Microbacterium album TaxID=2053191 RepID=A0A917IDR0_9MICO|nr:DUF998 domain-containing protein [Microbacterium album]GGH38071.1 hypothetical protein GCM10010921_08430 [Microbacterium album]